MNAHSSLNSAATLLNFSSRQKLPIIIQAEAAECGLACLAMILGYYGYETDLVSLRRRFPLSNHGASFKTLMDIAHRTELIPRALRAEPEDLKDLALPCILHWELNHFVVLKKVTKKGIYIHDPAIGERKISHQEFNVKFTGVILELAPTQTFQKQKNTNHLKITDLWQRIVGLKRTLAQIIVLSLLLQVFALISPFYMQIVVDDVLVGNDRQLLVVLAIGFSLLLIITLCTTVLRQYIVLYLTNQLSMQMSANLFRHLIRLPMSYFSSRHMGDVVSRFGSIDTVRNMLTNGMVSAFVDGIMAIFIIAFMLVYDARLTLVVLAAVIAYGLVRWAMYQPLKDLNQEVIVQSAKENSHFMESIRAIQTIKLFQKEGDRQNQWQNNLAAVMNKEIQISKWEIGYSTANGLIFGIENVLVVYLGALSIIEGSLSIGMLFAFMAYKGRFTSAMDSLINQWVAFKMLDLHLSRLADVVHTETESLGQLLPSNALDNTGRPIKNSELKALELRGKIEVRNLSFRYSESENYLFENLNFIIKPQETVAFIGPSGCGKTTLIKCLMGLLQPTSGEILIDDKPLHSLPYYRSQIASVMQEDQLLAGDLAQNIACFDSKIDMERVANSATMACISEDIQRFSMGYQTLVGDMGASLSGGQKQRLIIARALYRQPKILFMDEATSHLDVNNEAVVNKNILDMNITRIIVAHRPETIASTDRQITL